MEITDAAKLAIRNQALAEQKAQNKELQKTNVQSALLGSSLSREDIEGLRELGGRGIVQFYMAQFQQQAFDISIGNFSAQNEGLIAIENFSNNARASKALSNIDFSALGYKGKNPLTMDKKELEDLLGEEGFFGVVKTSARIADFVIQAAGDDVEKLKKGFEGVKNGFKEAQNLWGGKLPKISQETIDKTIEKLSARLEELGSKAVNIKA